MDKDKKAVLPNVGQAHEFFRQLKDRGVGVDLVQQAIQDPDPVAQFLLEHYGRRFSPKDCQALERAGWEIVQVPGILTAPVTLNQLYLARDRFGAKFWTSWHGDFTREDIEYLPLPAGEIAWMPKDPLIPGSTEKSFAEQEEVVAEFSQKIQKRFGDGVETVFPTIEHGIYLLFDHHRRTGKYVLSDRYTRTINRFGSLQLFVGYSDGYGVCVSRWPPEYRYWDLGVLRLVEPRS